MKTSCRDSVRNWWQIHDGFLRLIRLFGILDSNSLCDPRLSVYPACLCYNYLFPTISLHPQAPSRWYSPWPVGVETSTLSDSLLNSPGFAQGLTRYRRTVDLNEHMNEWSWCHWVHSTPLCSSPHLPGAFARSGIPNTALVHCSNSASPAQPRGLPACWLYFSKNILGQECSIWWQCSPSHSLGKMIKIFMVWVSLFFSWGSFNLWPEAGFVFVDLGWKHQLHTYLMRLSSSDTNFFLTSQLFIFSYPLNYYSTVWFISWYLCTYHRLHKMYYN